MPRTFALRPYQGPGAMERTQSKYPIFSTPLNAYLGELSSDCVCTVQYLPRRARVAGIISPTPRKPDATFSSSHIQPWEHEREHEDVCVHECTCTVHVLSVSGLTQRFVRPGIALRKEEERSLRATLREEILSVSGVRCPSWIGTACACRWTGDIQPRSRSPKSCICSPPLLYMSPSNSRFASQNTVVGDRGVMPGQMSYPYTLLPRAYTESAAFQTRRPAERRQPTGPPFGELASLSVLTATSLFFETPFARQSAPNQPQTPGFGSV
ncbi:hypothetical protein N658DRAFT_234018 [Parathielavia hyrcaniae]|uniref:Uncharacterized protein n=1 Tax=Parathielavia hyrcaniae TaxID=113614 RepID=A0AAN6T3X0_9PEZI|nr:hypothetical protein N658DRAFT_234018 [Parathielavia hyrcaniae]